MFIKHTPLVFVTPKNINHFILYSCRKFEKCRTPTWTKKLQDSRLARSCIWPCPSFDLQWWQHFELRRRRKQKLLQSGNPGRKMEPTQHIDPSQIFIHSSHYGQRGLHFWWGFLPNNKWFFAQKQQWGLASRTHHTKWIRAWLRPQNLRRRNSPNRRTWYRGQNLKL